MTGSRAILGLLRAHAIVSAAAGLACGNMPIAVVGFTQANECRGVEPAAEYHEELDRDPPLISPSFAKRHRCPGHLLQGRFKSQMVESGRCYHWSGSGR